MHDKRTGTDTVRIGVLYPMHAAEDEYPRMAAMVRPAAVAVVEHTDAFDLHSVEECRRTGDWDHLRPGVEALRSRGVDVCMWACTSGSFVYGLEGAREQARQIGDELGVPSSSTSLAFVEAARAMGIGRVAVAATYPHDLAEAFVDFMAEGGVEVAQLASLGIWTAEEVGHVAGERVIEFVRANDHVDAEAVLVPDTALHTAAVLDELDAALGKPVLTANQVSMWEALRLGGQSGPQTGFGQLFGEAVFSVEER